MDPVLLLKNRGGLDAFPGRTELDQDPVTLVPCRLVQLNELKTIRGESALRASARRATAGSVTRRALVIMASLSKDSRASTSVDTRPGTSFKISMPKLTNYRA